MYKLKEILGSPLWVRIYPKRRHERYVRIEASMGSSTTGVELSNMACRKLKDFFTDYHKANNLDSADVNAGVGWEGMEIDVLPDHALLLATQIVVFITNPANHDFVGIATSFVIIRLGTLESTRIREWTAKHAKVGLKKLRQEIESNYPDLVDDPLHEIP